MHSIYALIDPRTSAVHYVGMSKDPQKRYAQHLLDWTNQNKNEWIAELKSGGLRPVLIILETNLDLKSAKVREEYWINFYAQQDMPLANITSPVLKLRPGQALKPEGLEEDLITAGEVATIWNMRAEALGYHTKYTRKSVHVRKSYKGRNANTLHPAKETALGCLYRRKDAWEFPIQPQRSHRNERRS